MAFIPRKTNNDETVIRNYLMNGDVIRLNGMDQFDLVDAAHRNSVSHAGNIGCSGYPVPGYQGMLELSIKVFFDTINKLKSEGYNVIKVSCSGSGCCQYATYGYMLEGEVA